MNKRGSNVYVSWDSKEMTADHWRRKFYKVIRIYIDNLLMHTYKGCCHSVVYEKGETCTQGNKTREMEIQMHKEKR